MKKSLIQIQNTVLLLLLCAGIVGCGNREVLSEPNAEANADAPQGMLFLSRDQQQRMGLVVQEVQQTTFAATLPAVGWLQASANSEMVMRAPASGFLQAVTEQHPLPSPGSAVESASQLAKLNVFLSPLDVAQLVHAKEETDIQIEQSLVSMKIAEEQLARVDAAKDAVVGVRINELKEAYERSKAAYVQAQEKLPFLIKEPYDSNVLMKPVSINAERTGRVHAIHATAGQFVQVGEPLWTIGDWSILWLRVPVFEADAIRIMKNMPATLRVGSSTNPIPLEPLSIPAETTPGMRTVDLYFVVPNSELSMRPGQSLTVSLPLSAETPMLLIPRSALLYDNFGNAFVYVQDDDARANGSSFHRVRIRLSVSEGAEVGVQEGLQPNDRIVTTGAESVFAEEFRGNLTIEDDD